MASISASDFPDRLGRDVRLHAGLEDERPWALPELEAGARAVGVALLLAQVHVDAADELPAEDHVHHEQRVIVGRAARQADVAHAQLRLRGAGAVHGDDAAGRRRRGVERSDVDQIRVDALRAGPVAEGPGDERGEAIVRRIADGNHCRVLRRVHPAVKSGDVGDRQGAQRFLGADRQVPVGVLGIEQLGEDAVGDGRRQIAELDEPAEPELAHSIEVAWIQARGPHHRGEQLQCPRGVLFERRQLEQRRVGADLGIEMRADAAERLVHRERVEIAAAFVQQIAGDGGEARLMPGILRRADRHQHETGDERHFVVLDGADAQAVVQRAPPHFRKVEAERRPGLRQP